MYRPILRGSMWGRYFYPPDHLDTLRHDVAQGKQGIFDRSVTVPAVPGGLVVSVVYAIGSRRVMQYIQAKSEKDQSGPFHFGGERSCQPSSSLWLFPLYLMLYCSAVRLAP